jgi:hypothetical protein
MGNNLVQPNAVATFSLAGTLGLVAALSTLVYKRLTGPGDGGVAERLAKRDQTVRLALNRVFIWSPFSPQSMRQARAHYVDGSCPFALNLDDDYHLLVHVLESAVFRVRVAMYRFADLTLAHVLRRISERGVKVDIDTSSRD